MVSLFRCALLLVLATHFLASCAAPKGVYHTVQRGQTLYRIGRVYQVDVNQLARINRLSNRSQLKVGQRLFIPGASRAKYVPATALASSRPSTASTSRKTGATTARKKSSPSASLPAKKTVTAKTSRPSPSLSKKPPSMTKGSFVWPAKGSVIKRFGKNGSGSKKGIEIATRGGSAVVAAAAGKVTYSGDGIKGFGNLIILKHDHSYFTVYGFNKANLVRTGSFVSQGEKIALAGRPPGGGQSRLHFEIRQGKEAVNPIKLLP